jgi:hypothetical protein
MPVGRTELERVLAHQDQAALAAILDAAGVRRAPADDAPALARRVTRTIWRHSTTPIGTLRDRSLDDIVARAARRVKVELPPGDAWSRLRALTRALAPAVDRVSLADLDDATRARLRASWLPAATLAGAGAGSLGVGIVGDAIVRFSRTPIGRLLPFVPRVGPVFRTVRTGARVASVAGGPLAIALAVLSLDQSFGADFRKLLPLLLGVGALAPEPPAEAVEV